VTKSPLIPIKHLFGRQGSRDAIVAFAEHTGLVHFGRVSQFSEEIHIVRGLTLSNQHHDIHYCIGTYRDYDVAFVERSDVLPADKKKPQHTTRHVWYIFEYDLHTTADLPHVFIGRRNGSKGLYTQVFTKFPSLRSLHLGALSSYPAGFFTTYHVYAVPSDQVAVEGLVTPAVADMILHHFGALAIEINHNSLYIYSEGVKLTTALLETMLENGIWLANQIDASAGKPVASQQLSEEA